MWNLTQLQPFEERGNIEGLQKRGGLQRHGGRPRDLGSHGHLEL